MHTGRFDGGGALWAAFPRQVNQLRSLWALHSSTLGPLTENLTPVTAAELAAGAVPHVSMVTHCALVQAASLGSGTFVTAATGSFHFGLTLVTGDGLTGVCVTFGLTPVTHTCGAGVLLPLLSMLMLCPCRQTGVGHTLRTALTRLDHQVLIWFAGHLLTLCHRTLDVPAPADTSGAAAGRPLLSIPVAPPLPGARLSVASTLGAALPGRGEEAVIPRAGERWAGQSAAGHTPSGADTQRTGRRTPLTVVSISDSLVLARVLGGGDALWTAGVGRNPQTLAPLEVTLWVGAVGVPADDHVAVTRTLLT